MADSKFLINLRDLPCDRALSVDNAYVAGVLAGHPLRDALEAGDRNAGAGTLSASLYNDEQTVFVQGRVEGWLEIACSRCVEPARLSFAEDLRVTFVPQKQLEEDSLHEDSVAAKGEPSQATEDRPEDAGAEMEEGDLDLFGYVGETIDLEPLVREQFVLAIPFAPLCKDDCKGLCAQCGTNLNNSACSCPPIVDGRWEALGKMKLPS